MPSTPPPLPATPASIAREQIPVLAIAAGGLPLIFIGLRNVWQYRAMVANLEDAAGGVTANVDPAPGWTMVGLGLIVVLAGAIASTLLAMLRAVRAGR